MLLKVGLTLREQTVKNSSFYVLDQNSDKLSEATAAEFFSKQYCKKNKKQLVIHSSYVMCWSGVMKSLKDSFSVLD